MGRPKRGCGRVGDKFWAEEKKSFGFRYLSKLGWKPGEGMGVAKQGRSKYVHVTVRKDNQGLGKKEYNSNEHFKATINMYNDLLSSIQKRCKAGPDGHVSSEEEDKDAGRFMSSRELIQRDRAKSFYKRFHLARNKSSSLTEELKISKDRVSTEKVIGFTEEDQTNIALKLKALSKKTPGKKGLGFGSTNLVKNSYVKEYVKPKGLRITAEDSKINLAKSREAKKEKKSRKKDSKKKKAKKKKKKKRRASADRKRRMVERKRKAKKKKRKKKTLGLSSESKLEEEAIRIAQQLLQCKKTEKSKSKKRKRSKSSAQKKSKAERKLEREKKKRKKKETTQSGEETINLTKRPSSSTWSGSFEEEALRIASLLGSNPVTKKESIKERKKKKKKKRFKAGRDGKS